MTKPVYPQHQDTVDDVFENFIINNKKRISEELFVKLRDAIISGALHPGYIFPNENDLCKLLDIGRSTLREAYAPLERLSLITRTKNGTFVNSESDVKNSMNFDVIAQYANPKDIMEYRRILEVGAASSAAKKATAADIKKLLKIVGLMEKNQDSPELLTIHDFEFHAEITNISGNELLSISLNSIRMSYEKFALEGFRNNLFGQSVKDHRGIISSLEKNDPELAEELMSLHLRHIEDVTRYYV